MKLQKTREKIIELKHIESCEYFIYEQDSNIVDFIARGLKDERYGQRINLSEQNGRDLGQIVVAKFNKINE